MTRKEEILKELDVIHQLEFKIETRIRDGLKRVWDIHGVELTEENIGLRVREMAARFASECKVQNPMLVTVREGAAPFAERFMSELDKLNFRYQRASISTSSYHGTSSSGEVRISPDEKLPCGGRDVFLLEDVIDLGNTYKKLIALYELRGVASINLIAMIDKKQPRDVEACLTGFTIGKDEFIVGMGLDFDELLRTLTWIGAVDTSLLPTEEERKILGQKRRLNEELRECIALEKQVQPKNSFFLDCVVSAGLVGVAALGAMAAVRSEGVGMLTTVAALTGLTKIGLFARSSMARNDEAMPLAAVTGPSQS